MGDGMSEFIALTRADGSTFSAYCAKPQGRALGAIIVLQEIFGVNAHMRAVADRYAEAGYWTLAPSLFDRSEPGVDLGYGPDDVARGMQLVGRARAGETTEDIATAVSAAMAHGRVGIVGYCWGGTLSYLAAAQIDGLAAAVGYYGGGIARSLDQVPKIPMILHFGERDKHIPLFDVAEIRRRRPEIRTYTYPADHGFNCEARASYDRPSAELAYERSLAFFAQHLSQPAEAG
jgi:carboxymethylenebutenolidase